MSEKWSKEFDSCFQVGSIEEIADALEKRSGSEENALAMLAMTAFTLMTRRGICEMQNVVTNGAIVIHTQRLKSDPGGNLLS
ncbi:hypothetical protein BF288_23070 [Escherichia coli]|nr:hypothetical protein [Escherichia coli]